MKKLVSIIILCLGCLGILGAQNIWKPINGAGILGVGPDGNIFAYSEYGELSRSQDEGETWQIVLGQETGFTGHINSSCFAVSHEGRICVFNDNQQTVVYSDDGGDTWQQTTSMSSCAMPDKTGLCAPTNDIFVIWAENGEINYSLDGGETWDGWIPDFMNADNGPAISDLLVNENGDVYLGLRTIGGEGGIFRSTLSDMQNWEIASAAGLAIMDMEFDPEGNVVACGWRTEGSIGFQQTPGFYLFDGTSLAIGDGGIVYTPHYSGLQAVLSYSTDHGEHFIEIGEHLPLVDIAPGSENGHLFKGYDNHLYFDGGGEYWKSISDADHITNDGNYVPLIHEGNDRQKWNVVYIGANENYPNDYFTEIQSIRDNITLDGVDYKLVWRESVHESKRIAGAVREEDKRVYFRRYWQQSYQDEVLLYDFNLTVGDTVSVGWGDYRLIVLEESQVQVQGTMRKQLGLAMYFGNGTTREIDEYWIEGVGSTYGFLNSGYEGWVGAFVHLLCYHENGNLVWDNEEFDDCVMNSDGTPATFAPQGAEWYFDVWSVLGSPTTYYHMEVLGDTLIQGHQCSVITRQYLGGNGNEQFVYEDNDVVYWYNQTMQDFTMLYDFNAEAGESWICDIDSCSFEVQVQSIEEVSWGGHTYRVQNVVPIVGDDYNGEPFFWGAGRIIEGIGAVGLFPNSYTCFGGFNCGPAPDYLRCYLVDGEMLYHEGDFDCDAVLPWQYPCWDGTVAESYDGGNGTAEDPYQIATPQQLALLAQQTNDGTGGDAYYLLTDDICLNANLEMWYHQWIPIGRVTDSTVAYFRGHFDGNGKTISKLLIETNELMTDPVIGLFGCTDDAEIVNVNLSDCRLTGGEYAGGLVGYAGSTDISNCSVQSSQITTSGGVAGGIVGYAGMPFRVHETNENISKITNCRIDLVTVESVVDAGGIVGKINDGAYYARYLVSNCVTYNEQYYHIKGSVAGGIVGEMRFGMIEGCSSRSIVDGAGQVINVCVGGIAGSIHGSCVIANSYNRYDVVADFGVAGGIVGYSAGDIYNVYNVGEIHLPDPNSSGYGTIVGNVQAGERLNCYWLENDLPAAGNPILPDMPGSTSFHRDSTATSWVLAEPQYGTVDLVEALNAGASEIESHYPEMRPVSRWKYSDAPIDYGLPVFEPNNSEDDALEEYCEAPFNFGGSPISDQGTYGAQLWWNKPFASHWFHYDEKPYAGSVYRNSWGIKIPAEEIQRGDLLTHVAFYRAGGQDQAMEYRFAFGFEGETEPDSWDYLPGNSVRVEPGPDGWVMAKLGSPIECIEGKCLWIVLEVPNVMGNPAAYCQASGNPNACWSSEGSAAGDWMIRGYFTNDVGYNDPGYNEDLDHYNIYRGSSLEELEKIAEVGRDEEEYFDTLQQPFGDYYYQLTASYTDGRESAPAKRGENPHDPDYVYFHVGNISSLGSEWYYEIENEDGSITYQHLEYDADTTVNNKDVKIIIRTNTLYDKGGHNEVTREYIYEDFGKVYWWNETLQNFTMLYDLGAQVGDSWVIRVGEQSIVMHVDSVEQYEYEGQTYRMLHVSDADDLFSGTIMSGIGHLTSFFPEKLMTRGKNYRVEGIRCYWREGQLVFKYGDRDCDEVYEEWHNGIDEPVENQFNIYPNPTNGILTIHHSSFRIPHSSFRITNLMGQTLMSGSITAETRQIDVSALPEGMYFIIIGNATQKVVVNK